MQSSEWNKSLGIRVFIRKRTAHFTVHGADGLKLLLSEDEMANIIHDLLIAESQSAQVRPPARIPRIARLKRVFINLWYEPLTNQVN